MKYINRPEAERRFKKDQDVYLISKENGKAVKVNRGGIARFFGVAKAIVTLDSCRHYGYAWLGEIRYSSYVHPELLAGSWVIAAMKQKHEENRLKRVQGCLNPNRIFDPNYVFHPTRHD